MRISELEVPFAVLCDFDGTITLSAFGAMGLLFRQFADEDLRASLIEKFSRHEISSEDVFRQCFATIKAGKEEMEAFLKTVEIDRDLGEVMAACEKKGSPFVIVSDGLVWYIRIILAHHNLPAVPVYANDIVFSSDGYDFLFPYWDENSPLLGISKVNFIRQYQEKGYLVVFIGDGVSDREAAGVADITYAKGDLLDYCRREDITVLPYNTLADVL